MEFMQSLLLSNLIDHCYEWLCKRRLHHGDHHSIWDVRTRHKGWESNIAKAWSQGKWKFAPTRFIKMTPEGEYVELWEAQDAWLIKTVAEALKGLLASFLSKYCYHLAGGHKLLLRNIIEWIQQNGEDLPLFIYKTDVRSYYQSIHHHVLMHQLRKQGICEALLSLIWNYLTRLVSINANLIPVKRGIPKGCCLSPVLSALYLSQLDHIMAYRMNRSKACKGKIFYGRFQDDWVVLTMGFVPTSRLVR